MGLTVSHMAAASPSVPPPPPLSSPPASSPPSSDSPAAASSTVDVDKEVTKTDYSKLPCPVKFEEISREAYMSLNPELFEGLRFDFTKPLNQHFALSHGIMMGNMEVPAQSSQVLKIPQSSYEFGANVIDQRYMLIGRLGSDGRMSARMSYSVNDWLALKLNAQLTSEPHFSQGMAAVEVKGDDFQAQVQLGNNAYYGFNYMQSVTPTLSLGGEAFFLGTQRRSGIGLAGRYNTDKAVATVQAANTGILSLTYMHKVSDKVSLGTDFLYNHNSGEATTSVGYDYMLRQARLRGRIDTNGSVVAFLEERLNVGVNLIFSAEVDHWKKDYKFGFGMTIGE